MTGPDMQAQCVMLLRMPTRGCNYALPSYESIQHAQRIFILRVPKRSV